MSNTTNYKTKHMKQLHTRFNQVIVSYNLEPFTNEEYHSITEMFHNMTEQDVVNLADDYAREIITHDYETMYV